MSTSDEGVTAAPYLNVRIREERDAPVLSSHVLTDSAHAEINLSEAQTGTIARAGRSAV